MDGFAEQVDRSVMNEHQVLRKLVKYLQKE
jgi:hypothetical protein